MGVHTSNRSKATILVDAKCDFEHQEKGGRLPLGGLRTVGRHKAGDKSTVPTTSCHALKESLCPIIKSSLYLVTTLTNCSSYIMQKEGPIISNESLLLLVTLERKAMLCLYSLLSKMGKEKGQKLRSCSLFCSISHFTVIFYDLAMDGTYEFILG